MKYVKTYELFGNLFGKKKGVSKNVKPFLAHEKEEKAKRDKMEEDQRKARERLKQKEERFRNRIKSAIENISHPCINRTEVDVRNSRITVLVVLNVGHLNDAMDSFKSQNGLSIKDMEIRNPILNMEFSIKPDYDRISYGGKRDKNYIGVFHDSYDILSVWMKDVVDYKGNVSSESTMKQLSNDRYRGISTSNPPVISFEHVEMDNVSQEQIELIGKFIISISNSVGGWIMRDIYGKVREFNRLREFEVISTFSDDEVKDYMSDLIDISSDHEIQRTSENISIKFQIEGLRNYHDSGMKMTKLNSQVVKYLTEIQGRLEERELEISVRFETNTLAVLITKMESEQPIKHKRIARKAPR